MTHNQQSKPHEWRYWWSRVDLVVAVYTGDRVPANQPFQSALGRCLPDGNRPWQMTADWMWLTRHLYETEQAIAAVDAILQSLDPLSFRIRLKAGTSWTLRLFARGTERFCWTHDFSLLHPRQHEHDYIATLAKAYEGDMAAYLEDYEWNLPETVTEPLRQLPFAVAHQRCWLLYQEACATQAAALAALLADYGITCDRTELAAILTGQAMVPAEFTWYVGNLPRFLTAIGLGSVFADWQAELA